MTAEVSRQLAPVARTRKPPRRSRARALALGWLACCALLGASTPAQAQNGGSVAAAAALFADAQRADIAGQTARAAELYELADRLVPDPAALRSAARAHHRAGHRTTAARLAAELRRRDPASPRSLALAEELLTALEPDLVRLKLHCVPSCAAALDGRPVGARWANVHIAYAAPGRHRLTARFSDGEEQSAAVRGIAGERLELRLRASESSIARQDVHYSIPPWRDVSSVALEADDSAGAGASVSSGLSPAWFAVAAGVTVAVGAAGIWSAIDQLQWDAANERGEAGAETKLATAEVRTSVLVGATAVSALGTGLLALFTDWGIEPAPGTEPSDEPADDGVDDHPLYNRAAVVPLGGGALVSWGMRF